MERIENIRDMQSRADRIRKSGLRIGFVPTMGYLHKGHLSLIDEAKKVSDIVVVSIFVNPAPIRSQRGLRNLSRNISRDEKLAEEAGADIIFHPSVRDMYPDTHLTWVHVEKLTEILCGAKRKGHFRGVTTVVSKLFHIVKPHTAVFGQKDAQQAAVIKKMVDDLNMDVTIHIAPTIREPDGLAMSSRNVLLTP
ncbi:MAG: pantoate--beta-alanine ligase [Candidatus Marinimicrobia bacterium]|nr:pantoate--beta-alanine ligase [Candidatus Neomarinimicrobiota bacterium]